MSTRFSMVWVIVFFGILFIPTSAKLITLILASILLILILLVQLSIMVRRMHDLNWSGIWLLIIVPVYLFSISTVESTRNDPLLAFASVGVLLILLVSAFLGFKKGTNGANKYGQDPLG